jgi:hypothetical protein
MRLIKKAFLIWLSITILSSIARGQDDVVLNRGDIAPFDGVIVSYGHYRAYSNDVDFDKFIQQNKDLSVSSDTSSVSNFTWIAGSFLAGFIVGVLVVK